MLMPKGNSNADLKLRHQLKCLDLPPSEFNHERHVRLAYIFLREQSQKDAFASMRDWTFRYLAHHEIDLGKYNETLTRAWMLAVRHFMASTPFSKSSDEFIRLSPRILDSRIMMTHYSRELLFSEVARNEFVEPDLEPIPRYPDRAA